MSPQIKIKYISTNFGQLVAEEKGPRGGNCYFKSFPFCNLPLFLAISRGPSVSNSTNNSSVHIHIYMLSRGRKRVKGTCPLSRKTFFCNFGIKMNI
jgi:hypothetical protein